MMDSTCITVCARVCACVRHVCIRILLASHQHAASRRLPGGLDMSVVVLTMGYWPTYTPMTVHIPQQVSAVCACMHACMYVCMCGMVICMCLWHCTRCMHTCVYCVYVCESGKYMS